MQIPEAELEDKRRRVRDGQQHRKYRVDPADKRQESASGSKGKSPEDVHREDENPGGFHGDFAEVQVKFKGNPGWAAQACFPLPSHLFGPRSEVLPRDAPRAF